MAAERREDVEAQRVVDDALSARAGYLDSLPARRIGRHIGPAGPRSM